MNKLKIAFIGNLKTLPSSPDHAGILQTLEGYKNTGKILDYVIGDPSFHERTSSNMLETVAPFQPDLIIHGMTNSLTDQLPEKLRAATPKSIQVMSMWDYRPSNMMYDGLWDTWKKSGKFLDLVTLSNKGQMQWWKDDFGVDTMFWPHGCVIQDVETDPQFEFDAVFLGDRHMDGPYRARVDFVDEIHRGLKQQGMELHWINKGGGDADPDRARVWQNLGKIYHTSKTALDISHFWDDPGYASGRYFYTSGMGGCAIAKRFPDCEELFPEGTKAYFDTPTEAIEKMKYYIDHEDERNEIKRNGKEWANKYHNYDVRFRELFKKLGIKF